MDINQGSRTKHKIARRREFDDGLADLTTESHSAEQSFRINYYLHIVDQTIASLNTRFKQYKEYGKTFCFLFTSDRPRSLDDESLNDACVKLEAALKHETHRDIDGGELWRDLVFIKDLLEKSMCPFYPIADIAYRILSTVPITVASAENELL